MAAEGLEIRIWWKPQSADQVVEFSLVLAGPDDKDAGDEEDGDEDDDDGDDGDEYEDGGQDTQVVAQGGQSDDQRCFSFSQGSAFASESLFKAW